MCKARFDAAPDEFVPSEGGMVASPASSPASSNNSDVNQIDNVIEFPVARTSARSPVASKVPSPTSLDEEQRPDDKNKNSNSITFDLLISGMSCASCAVKLAGVLGSVPELENASVNFATERATVTLSSSFSAAAVLEAVIEAGAGLGYTLVLAGTDAFSFGIIGMSCGSCVGRAERVLGNLPGVLSYSVNLTAETAEVTSVSGTVTGADITTALATLGYEVVFGIDLAGGKGRGAKAHDIKAETESATETERPSSESAADRVAAAREREYKVLRRVLIISVLFTIPVIALSHIPLSILGGLGALLAKVGVSKVQFLFAVPVQFYCGARFYSRAFAALRHGFADMNTLVAVGTSAAFFYSVAATFSPGFFTSSLLAPVVYFDTAAMIIVLILFGRLLEARAKGRTGAAIKRLIGLSPAPLA